MKRYVAVIGLGEVGSATVETVAKEGCRVLAIDRDKEAIERIERLNFANVETAILDATDEAQLKEDGRIKDVQAVFIALSSYTDVSDVLANLEEFGVKDKEVWVRIDQERHRKALKKLGATNLVFPERECGVRMGHTLAQRGVRNVIELGADIAAEEIVISEKFAGKTLQELQLKNVQVILVKYLTKKIVKKNGNEEEIELEERVAYPMSHILRAGDIITIAGERKYLEKAVQELA